MKMIERGIKTMILVNHKTINYLHNLSERQSSPIFVLAALMTTVKGYKRNWYKITTKAIW